MQKDEQVYSVHPEMVQTALIGKPLFLDSNLSLLAGIKLLTPAIAKSNSLMAPSFSFEANTVLVKSHSKDQYSYYVAQPLKNRSQEDDALSALKVGTPEQRSIELLGMRQLANTNQWELFAQLDNKEYTYAIASTVQWETVELQSPNEPGHAESLVYLGQKQDKLFFRYTALKNTVADSEYAEENIELPVSQKVLQIGGKTIEILAADNSLIQFKLSIDSSQAL